MTDRASEILRRLRSERDLVAVVACPAGDATTELTRAAAWLGIDCLSLAREAFSSVGFDQTWSPSHDAVLSDIDLLFSPQLAVDPLSHLRHMARSAALVAAWPGRTDGGRLTYSVPGRHDRYDVPAKNILVLNPLETHFPDEDPYKAEYHPA